MGLVSAYNVSHEYPLNESAGAILDESVDSLRGNSLLTVTLPEVLLVLLVLFAVCLPVLVFLMVLILALKKFAGGRKG